MKRYILLAVLLLMAIVSTAAQGAVLGDSLPPLTAGYYDGVTFLNQNYNYELSNKKRALRRNSKDILIAGIALYSLGYMATTLVAGANDWSLAVAVPAQIAVGGAILLPAIHWSSHLRKKADAIQVETAYVLPLGEHTELGPAMFRNSNEHSMNAIGIGLKTTF